MARKAKADELVLVGGGKARRRKVSARDWTKAKQENFLSVLAATCNVTVAAAEAGVSSSAAYRRRKVDAGFRGAWMQAIGTAYQRLEMVLLERAFVGTEKLVRRKDGREERMVEYPNQLALTSLKMHRDTAVEATAEIEPDDIEEVRERVLGKLEPSEAGRSGDCRRMSSRTTRDLVRALAKASPEERIRIIHSMTPIELLKLDAWFEAWAHEGQLPPDGNGWRVWLMMAGRGFGKTRAGAEWVHALASGSVECASPWWARRSTRLGRSWSKA